MRLQHDTSPRALVIGLIALAAMLPWRLLARDQAPQSTAQNPPSAPAVAARGGRGAGPQAPQIVSPEVLPDRRVVFRLHAPEASEVSLRGVGRGGPPMVKNAAGVWKTAVGPVAPGAYRYSFNVHGATVVDPNNQAVSESTTGVGSLLVVPGTEWMDTKNVPHGAVAQVRYQSTVLGRERRMHVYTPAGYGVSTERYPVLYAGVFSAGLGGGGAGQPSAVEQFEAGHKAALQNEALRKSMRLIWFSTGRDDGAMTGTTNAVNLLKKHGFTPEFRESAGGHTWENWRDYLVIFTQRLFQ
jgi:hypothetical protein